MDERIVRWAKTLVSYCLEIQPGQTVLIGSAPAAADLVGEVYREVLRAGGHPITNISLPALHVIALREGSDEQLAWVNPVDRMLAETVDARLNISAAANTRQLSNLDPSRVAVQSRATREIRQINSRRSAAGQPWCGTLYPTEAYAQEAGMSLEEFREFVYEACFLNSSDPAEAWRAVGRQQQFYVDWLRDKRDVRVVGPDTDLSLSVAGRVFRNSDGKRNFPSGEFFTGPIEDSVNGHIRFTIPTVFNGHSVRDVRLTFERGRVVEASAAQGEAYLQQMLDLDQGSRYLGEFAFGNNFNIQRGTGNILFDEKIGGTVHMALGNSYPETGGKNVSALHWDMICDLRAPAGGGEVYVDGQLFLKDGRFVVAPGR